MSSDDFQPTARQREDAYWDVTDRLSLLHAIETIANELGFSAIADAAEDDRQSELMEAQISDGHEADAAIAQAEARVGNDPIALCDWLKAEFVREERRRQRAIDRALEKARVLGGAA